MITTLYKQSIKLITTLFLSVILTGLLNAQTDTEKAQYNDAMNYITQLNRVKANEILTDLIAKNPNYAAAQYQAGIIDNYFNNEAAALLHFKKVVALGGEFESDASFEISKSLIKAGKTDEALSILNKVLEKNNANDKAFFERGKIKLSQSNFTGAKDDLTTAILYNPNNYLYHYNRGLAFLELFDYPSAVQDFDKVIENIASTPQLENAYFYRGYAYYQEGIDPKYKGHKALLQKALLDYEKCISLDKKDEAAYYNRGEVHMALGSYIEAISDFKKAIMLNQHNYDARYNKAICNYHFGEEKSALNDMEELIKLNPKFADAYFQLGVWKYEQGDNKKALDAFNTLIEIENDHSDAYLFRGYTQLELNNTKDACIDWKKADTLGDKEAHKDLIKYCGEASKK